MKADVQIRCEGVLGHITLDRPNVLNALTHAMCAAILEALDRWAQDPGVHAILIDAVPGRAFCAGGDIRAIAKLGRSDIEKAESYFTTEYRMNAAIRHYPKPYIALLDGLTMGGGAGLSIHGARRVITERANFAMPETAIGLYPDIGGTYFLSRLAGETGTYLALTGARIGPADMLWLGLATDLVSSERSAQLARRLASGESTDAAIAALKDLPPGAPVLADYTAEIAEHFSASSVEEILLRLKTGSDWAREAAVTISRHSPTSLKLTLAALRRARSLNFDDCMRMEYRMTQRVLRGHDFYEGVRAILVEKDHNPRWNPVSLEQVTDSDIAGYFAPPGAKELPL